jgi:hypothetical protein
MVTVNDLITENSSLAISHEVLILLRWLVENNQEELAKLTKQAVQKELHTVFAKLHQGDGVYSVEDAYMHAAHFFGTIEALLVKELKALRTATPHSKILKNTVSHVDNTLCDSAIIHTSVEHAQSTALSEETLQREEFFKELLRQWRPRKSHLMH